jgi:outer membrane protein
MRLFVGVFGALALASTTGATDLIGVYADAARFDPQIREAEATYQAAREATPEAWAALLPQLTGNYTVSRQKQGEGYVYAYPGPEGTVIPFSENTTSFINTRGYQLQLQETIFSWANLATLAEAYKQVAKAEATYRAAQEDLIQRVATAYFNILNAKDTLDANTASLDAVSRQLDQASKRFEQGLIAITDVKEAQAARDSAAATVIAAKRTLASMEQELREITEQDYPSLAKPGDDMPLQNPQPADPQAWISVSMDQNLSLVASRLTADAAREQVRVAFGGHLPTVAITGTRSDQTENTDEAYNFGGAPGRLRYPFELADSQIGLEVSVPIFSGGLVQSEVHQAQFQWIAAKDHVQTVSRETEYQARDAYNGVVSEVAQVEALKQGVESAQVALTATEAGYQVGTRTEVEVLEERQNLVQAQTSYAQARYNYILDLIQLRLTAGTLDLRTLQEVNRWLSTVECLTPACTSKP